MCEMNCGKSYSELTFLLVSEYQVYPLMELTGYKLGL